MCFSTEPDMVDVEVFLLVLFIFHIIPRHTIIHVIFIFVISTFLSVLLERVLETGGRKRMPCCSALWASGY